MHIFMSSLRVFDCSHFFSRNNYNTIMVCCFLCCMQSGCSIETTADFLHYSISLALAFESKSVWDHSKIILYLFCKICYNTNGYCTLSMGNHFQLKMSIFCTFENLDVLNQSVN